MEYKALIFDLGKTLVNFEFARGYRALEQVCPHKAADIPRRLAATGLVEQFETGRIEVREFAERISAALDLRVDHEAFRRIWWCIFTDTLVPESLLSALHQRYRMVLLSNTNALHFEFIRERYPQILRHFDALVLSYEVKAMKPHPEIYRAALDEARCRPDESFYTDDIPEYVAGAQALGIDAVQFRGAAELEKDLRARGIGWEENLATEEPA